MAPSMTMMRSFMILLITSKVAVGFTGSTHLAYFGTGAAREGGVMVRKG